MSFPVHPWKVVERGWQPNTQRFAESLMSLANGYMGLRGNFEEDYSGDSFQGTYLGGVWYPDKTRVGWWKKGYPEYYAKVINAINLIGIHVIIDQHPLDLSRATVWEYEREVDMRTAVLYRHACVDMDKGSLTLDTWRFVSMDTKELLAIRYQVTPSFDCRMEISPYLDGNVRNLDANYDQSFWNMVDGEGWDERGGVLVQTKPNPYGVQRFTVAAAMTNRVEGIDYIDMASKAGYCAALYAGDIHSGTTVSVEKYVAVFTSRDHDKDQLMDLAMAAAQQACDEGWQKALKAHQAAWHERWEMADVQIEGDDSAQQGIHFNLFQLLSTYTGSDARLNIGPKGYTGERFGGSTYWDTEAYCLPVFLAIRGADTARQLLLYRYHHLEAAKRNAANLGMPGALYPVSTINGSECHNEWEVAFEGIHRNAAIVHAIFEYTMYTGDETYLLGEGVEVMAEIAKFAPELRCVAGEGTQAQRAQTIARLSGENRDVDVYLTSYPLIRRDIGLLSKVPFRFAILDEAQYIKNAMSVGAGAVKQLKAQTRLALTGTPMENHPGELWSIFDFVLPGYLNSFAQFMHRFGTGEEADVLRSRIRPFLLRRLKGDVLRELPEKVEITLTADMTEEQRRVYQASLLRLRPQVEGMFSSNNRIEMLAAITELRQICGHPSLVLPSYAASSGKLDLLLDVLPGSLEAGHRALIFSQFTRMLKILQRRLEAVGISCMYLDGETPPKRRIEMVQQFNAGEGQVFLISLKAGGSGLNLVGADTVIHFDPWWNPAAEDQATDRAHRIGQKHKVTVIRMITRGSIEEQVVKLGARKREMFDQMITAGEAMPTQLTPEDIRALFD